MWPIEGNRVSAMPAEVKYDWAPWVPGCRKPAAIMWPQKWPYPALSFDQSDLQVPEYQHVAEGGSQEPLM
jgi:hypothetical protein